MYDDPAADDDDSPMWRVPSAWFDGTAAYSDAVKGSGLTVAAASPSPEYTAAGVSLFGIGVVFDAFQGYSEQYFESEELVEEASSGRYRSLPGAKQYHDVWYDLWDDTTDSGLDDELEP